MVRTFFSSLHKDKKTLLLLVLILLSIFLRCLIFLADWETLVKFVPDDSFYYFQLASNIISGHGSSMDGVHLTNGYHPLWPIMISPLFLLKSIDPIIPVKLALFFSSLLTIISGYIFYKLARLITNSKAIGIFAFTLYVFNYYIILVESIGEPAGISNLLILVLLYLSAKYTIGKEFSPNQAILFGFIGGLSMMARTDNALYYAMFLLLGLLWFKPFRFINYVYASLTSIVVMLPWFIWNIVNFGTIVQTSATACPYIENMNAERSTLDLLLAFNLKQWLELLRISHVIVRYSLASYLFYPILLLGLFSFRNKNQSLRRGIGFAMAGILISFTLFILHYVVAMYLRDWHLAAVAPFVLLTIILTLWHVINSFPKTRFTWVLFGIYYFTVSLVMLVRLPDRPMYFWQIDALEAKEWVLSKPKGAVAVYDGGILQYLTDGWLFSIDSNVNNSAQKAVFEGRVIDYLRENNVRYLVDWEWIIKRYNKFWPHPEEEALNKIPMPPTRGYLFMKDNIKLYENSIVGPFRYWELTEPKLIDK